MVRCKYHRACGWSARWYERSQPSGTSLWPPGPRESSTQRNLANKPSRWVEGRGDTGKRQSEVLLLPRSPLTPTAPAAPAL